MLGLFGKWVLLLGLKITKRNTIETSTKIAQKEGLMREYDKS
jgi:hypothetical protein